MNDVSIYWTDVQLFRFSTKQIEACARLTGLPLRGYVHPKDQALHITGLLLAEWGRRQTQHTCSEQLRQGWGKLQLLAWGKPVFTESPAPEFNISHSGNLVICAIANRPLGVDIERVDREIRYMMERIAVPEEHRWMKLLPRTETELFQLWTYKESYLKCIGAGLSQMRKLFPMAEEDRLITSHGDYRFRPLSLWPGYSATLCTSFAVDTLSMKEIPLPCLIQMLEANNCRC